MHPLLRTANLLFVTSDSRGEVGTTPEDDADTIGSRAQVWEPGVRQCIGSQLERDQLIRFDILKIVRRNTESQGVDVNGGDEASPLASRELKQAIVQIGRAA